MINLHKNKNLLLTMEFIHIFVHTRNYNVEKMNDIENENICQMPLFDLTKT